MELVAGSFRLMSVEVIAVSAIESEADLVALARSGDSLAFADLVRRHDRGLRLLAFRLLGDRTSMDDALQEAYLRAFQALPRFRGDSSVGTWLYRIAYNSCIDLIRRTRDEDPVHQVEVAPGSGFEEQIATRVDLAVALDLLPLRQRAVVILVDGLGLDYATAAETIGVPVGTIRSRLSRGRAAVAKTLSEERTDG
jgi:RNA polymerase sigma-70 factor (ECF subfamily)